MQAYYKHRVNLFTRSCFLVKKFDYIYLLRIIICATATTRAFKSVECIIIIISSNLLLYAGKILSTKCVDFSEKPDNTVRTRDPSISLFYFNQTKNSRTGLLNLVAYFENVFELLHFPVRLRLIEMYLTSPSNLFFTFDRIGKDRGSLQSFLLSIHTHTHSLFRSYYRYKFGKRFERILFRALLESETTSICREKEILGCHQLINQCCEEHGEDLLNNIQSKMKDGLCRISSYILNN